MATLLDTSAFVVLVRKRRASGLEPLARAAREEIAARRVAVSSVTARRSGSVIPLADLLIAATALWLDLSLLTCDSDFERARRLDPGLRLHPASVVG